MKKAGLLYLLLLIAMGAYTQENAPLAFTDTTTPIKERPLPHQNTFFGSVGTIAIYSTTGIFYERILKHQQKVSPFVRIGAGGYTVWNDPGIYLTVQYGIVTGKQNHHMELSVGGILATDSLIPLSLNAGWRFQKPEKNVLYRAGVSWPEAVYFGVGYSF